MLTRDCGRLSSQEKKEIYAKYKSDPETYTVARLATVYGLNQPRVQAILLLEAWEEQERELGLVTPEDDKLEELVSLDGRSSLQLKFGFVLGPKFFLCLAPCRYTKRICAQ